MINLIFALFCIVLIWDFIVAINDKDRSLFEMFVRMFMIFAFYYIVVYIGHQAVFVNGPGSQS